MRRLLHIAYGVTVGLSVVLCVVVILLWRQSYSTLNEFHIRGKWVKTPTAPAPPGSLTGEPYWVYTRDTYQCVGSHRGRVYYARGGETPMGFELSLDAALEDPIDFSPVLTGGYLGFGRATPVGAVLRPCSVWFVPHWFLVLLTAILPAQMWIAREQRYRAKLMGLCPICGYDLRATPERCPECGTPVIMKSK